MYRALLIILFVISVFLVLLIMIQQSKSNDRGGVRSSGILINTSSYNTFMIKSTVVLAVLFFIISLVLSRINYKNLNTSNYLDVSSQAKKTKLSLDFSSTNPNKEHIIR